MSYNDMKKADHQKNTTGAKQPKFDHQTIFEIEKRRWPLADEAGSQVSSEYRRKQLILTENECIPDP